MTFYDKNNIFFPEKINGYYLFSQRIIAFEVGPTVVYASVIRAHRKKRFIQKFIEKPYNAEEEGSLTNAIKKIIQTVGPCDTICITLPSQAAVFKELNVPFTSLKKIKLVLPFEIEPQLPFALDDAVIDATINTINKETNRSNVFATAIKNSILNSYIAPFLQAGVQPTRICIDNIELYGLTQTIKEYKAPNKGVTVLIDLNQHFTHIVLVVDGAIKTIRVIPTGYR